MGWVDERKRKVAKRKGARICKPRTFKVAEKERKTSAPVKPEPVRFSKSCKEKFSRVGSQRLWGGGQEKGPGLLGPKNEMGKMEPRSG